MAVTKAAMRLEGGRFLISLCGLALGFAMAPELPAWAEDAPPASPAPVEAVAPAAPGAKDAASTATTKDTSAAPANKDAVVIPMLIARELQDEPLPISLLDLPPADLGVAGAKLAVADNNTTGRFMNQQFSARRD